MVASRFEIRHARANVAPWHPSISGDPFLETQTQPPPESIEHMLTFIYTGYRVAALLYETVPAFGDTWIECLGDLGRYRMAIEDGGIGGREVWTGVS